MAGHIVFGICKEAVRDTLNAGWNAAWGTGTNRFSAEWSDDGGVTLTHRVFNDNGVAQELAAAWQATQSGIWPAPISGEWGENGLPTEAALIAASTLENGNMELANITTLGDPDNLRAQMLVDWGLVPYDELAGT